MLNYLILRTSTQDARVLSNRVDGGRKPSTSHCTVRSGLVYGATLLQIIQVVLR